MANRIGTRGQVVISKEIRDRLGIQPGWLAIERIVDNHVEIYFVPPAHKRSLLGSLSHYATKDLPEGEEWDRIREAAWDDAVRNELEMLKDA